jgi:hypothetical protein
MRCRRSAARSASIWSGAAPIAACASAAVSSCTRWQSAASRVEATIAGGGEQERTELTPPLVARAGAPDLQEDVLRQIVTGRVVAQHLPAQRPDPVLVPPDDLAERGQHAGRRQRHELVVRPARQVAGRARRRHDGDDGGFTTHDVNETPARAQAFEKSTAPGL